MNLTQNVNPMPEPSSVAVRGAPAGPWRSPTASPFFSRQSCAAPARALAGATVFALACHSVMALLTVLVVTVVGGARGAEPVVLPTPAYEFRPASADGIGKFFLGREISHVMGHQGADWLERPEREIEERTDLVIPALQLRPGDVVADIGAGTGYFSWRLARAVGPNGRVLAVDIQPEMLEILGRAMRERGVSNVFPVLGTITDPRLPTNSLDLAIMVDVYHEFSHPYEMLGAICRALKPGGRVVFIEYRGEDPEVPIKPLHKMTQAEVKREATVHPLDWVETVATLPRQHLIIFRKRAASP